VKSALHRDVLFTKPKIYIGLTHWVDVVRAKPAPHLPNA